MMIGLYLFVLLGCTNWTQSSSFLVPGPSSSSRKRRKSHHDFGRSTKINNNIITVLNNNNIENVDGMHQDDESSSSSSFRRSMLSQLLFQSSAIATTMILTNTNMNSAVAHAATESTTADAQVTDKIFIEIKGLKGTTSSDGDEPVPTTRRIVIGLFGKDAPQPTSLLKQLVTPEGLTGVPCKPKETRTLQREQLEANKVYNSCIETQEKGVTYDLSTIWRIIPNERIDVASVSGKFISREFPNWTGSNTYKHDTPGIVSVRRGNESGFGFTIYPGNNSGGGSSTELDESHIVVGRVLEGLDVVEALNQVPVVNSAKVNYMALTGGPTTKDAPNRSCRYGGPLYCNENKPLYKLSITKTGLL
mmetsp:Transcript_19950/g.28250  ORF Transcript_19950/g.28250 Transcript_19950/m.28250 type:complete len:362 (-) Transcript_19950:219-1304(-)